MTKVLNLTNDIGISFSDYEFNRERKKPTMSIRQGNQITKVASFNSQETFEWFLEILEAAFNDNSK